MGFMVDMFGANRITSAADLQDCSHSISVTNTWHRVISSDIFVGLDIECLNDAYVDSIY